MEADPNWGRQVKSKKSKPNLKNSPRVKKKKQLVDIRQTEDESQDSIASSAGKLPASNEEIGEEIMSDSENEGEDQATDETDLKAEGAGADSHPQDNELLQKDTARTDSSGQGFYSNLPDLPLELDTDKIDFDFSDKAVEIDPQDMSLDSLQQNTADSGISAKRDNSDLQDMSSQQNTADTDISAKIDNSDLRDKALQQSSAETQLSDEGGDSDLQDANPQYNTATTKLTGERSESYVPDLNFQHDTTEASNVIKEAPEGADLQDANPQYNTATTKLTGERSESYVPDLNFQPDTTEASNVIKEASEGADLQDANPQYNTATAKLTGERSESYVPDLNFQPDTAEASNVIKEASEGASPVKESVCLVCNDAEATMAILPCRHLCLCIDCELECANCPVCGGPKNDYFYKTS